MQELTRVSALTGQFNTSRKHQQITLFFTTLRSNSYLKNKNLVTGEVILMRSLPTDGT